MSLEEVRKKIDEIDRELVRLLDRRARAGAEAAEIKKKLGQPLHNPDRERKILERLALLSDGSMPARGLKNIYRAIMTETLALEKDRDAHRHCGTSDSKRDSRVEIIENREEAPGFYRMRLRAPGLGDRFAPGQFFQIRVDDRAGQPFLRRPFAPSEAAGDEMSFFYAVVGGGTRMMAGLAPGTEAWILAPLGVPYTLLSRGQRALLIGGGCGAPSIAPLARSLCERGVETTVLMGARTASALLYRDGFDAIGCRLILATDDGSHGCRGTAIDAYRLDDEARRNKPDRIYACGPTPMLRAAAALARELDVACEVSLEERMACGFGACMGCAVPVWTGPERTDTVYRRVCHEGPVFDAATLAWDEMK